MNAAIGFALMAGALGVLAPDRKPVVLTTDIGAEVDDQWTMAHMALSPSIDLKGVVTTHAPSLAAPAAETSASFARELASKLPSRLRPPIFAGSSKPLAAPGKPLGNSGVDFLIEQAKGHNHNSRLTVVVIGAATDVASALLTDPTWADRVSIVAMGFDSYPQGGDPWNVKNDVIAWRTLLESRVPIVVGDVEITKRLLRMTPDRVHTLLAMLPDPAPLLINRFDSWIAGHTQLAKDETGSPIVWPIWDEVTTAYLLGYAQAESRPRPRLKDDRTFDLDKPQGTIEWITAIDEAKLWTDLVARIKSGGQ
jgi:inosine-uridine nucleoside N-ribohydrolase